MGTKHCGERADQPFSSLDTMVSKAIFPSMVKGQKRDTGIISLEEMKIDRYTFWYLSIKHCFVKLDQPTGKKKRQLSNLQTKRGLTGHICDTL